MTLKVGMVAGEVSGDLLAGLLLEGMRRRWPDMSAWGIGGPVMKGNGFRADWPAERLAVRGYIEVLRHYRGIVGIRKALKERLLADRPDLFIGVDAPDFNLDLEADLRQAGVPTVHFVCPSIWAWRPERVNKIRESVRHILCIYPFEPALLAEHGIEGTFVGHPVADVIPLTPDRAGARQTLGLDAERPVVALLPGSRSAEIRALALPFVQAAQRMRAQRPALQFVLPTHEGLRPAIEQALHATGMQGHVQLVMGQSHAVQAACDVALVASGTATLETALHKRPMVIAYKMQWLSWRIANGKRLLPWVGLPNILCNEGLVPEFLQEQVQPQALADATLAWLDDPAAVSRLQQRFAALHHELRQDMPTRSCHAIEKILGA